ncbi:MAG: triose-phosphate isomerase [Candidatus Nanoarchaeia archaeon]
MKPLIVVNLKTYKQGKEVIKLAKTIEKINKEIIIGAQATDIYEIKKATKLRIYSQHVDWQEKGRATGFILPEAIKTDGAEGVFLNHSEHKIKFQAIKKTIERCKNLKLKTMVFASSIKEALRIEKLRPDYIIYEPPELVAGKVSVSCAKPEVIKNLSKKLKIKFLVGAGIHTRQDLDVSVKLGARGIALSSAITLAKNPAKLLRELSTRFR